MVVRYALPYRLYTWVRCWWLKYRTPCHCPVTHSVKPTLERLEDRCAPTSLPLTAAGELASSQVAYADSGMESLPGDFWRNYGNGMATTESRQAVEQVAGPIGINCWAIK